MINDDETPYREEVRDLAVWCQDNNLSLNVSKTKELIVDYRKRRTEHAPVHIDGAVVERAVSFTCLGVHITKDLSLSTYTNQIKSNCMSQAPNTTGITVKCLLTSP